MSNLRADIINCRLCSPYLPLTPRPIFSFNKESKIVIIGQAPGLMVNKTGIPWDDKSGETLRKWMDIDSETFYNSKKIALIPMGFCYPGKGKSGDKPPRKECAPKWHDILLSQLKNVQLTLLIGKYAQDYYLKHTNGKQNLTETVKNYTLYLPNYFALPHPSPRNNIWQAKNKWFKTAVLPSLKIKIKNLLKDS